MSLEGRVTGTGPIPATMAPMDVDLIFKGTCFGKFQLPQVQTRFGGTQINVYDQTIKVLDMPAFHGFVNSIMSDEDAVLTLDNGHCSITSFGMRGKCTYRKDIALRGMRGPTTRIVDVADGMATIVVTNPSALEIDHGIVTFDVRTREGERIAQLKGPLVITRGECEINMAIVPGQQKPLALDTTTMVGMGCEKEAWTNETIQFFRSTLKLTEGFLSFL